MKKALTKVLLVALMAILPLSFYAQKKQTKPVEKYFYIFAEGGLSVNHTDLANYGTVPFYQNNQFVLNDGYVFKNFDGQLGLGYQFGKVMGINAKFGTATLAGEKRSDFGDWLIGIDALEAAENTAAIKPFDEAMLDKTTFMEANLNLTFNLTNLFFGYNPRRVFNFIPHVGIGGIRYHAGAVTGIQEDAEEPNIAAKETAEMTYTIPVGAELNFNLARKLDFFIDYTFTFAGNDRLDQVQKQPDDIQVINDMYSSVNAGLRFKFNKKPCDIEGMCPTCIDITTDPAEITVVDGKVSYDIVYEVPAEFFEKDAVMHIVPTFAYPGGAVEIVPAILVGENVEGGSYQVNYKKGGKYIQHVTLPYVSGMENGKINTNSMLYVYNGTVYANNQEIMKNAYFLECCNQTLTPNIIVPKECKVEALTATPKDNGLAVNWTGVADSYNIFLNDETKPVANVTGNTYTFENFGVGKYTVTVKPVCGDNLDNEGASVSGEIEAQETYIGSLFFDYESASLNRNAKANRAALNEIAATLASGGTINTIVLKGYASPENGDGNNQTLSENRAKEVEKAVNDLLKKAKLSDNFTVTKAGFGSDVDKFIELVGNNTSLKQDLKDAFIGQVNRASTLSKKEQEVSNIKATNGVVRDKILPEIRRVDVYVK